MCLPMLLALLFFNFRGDKSPKGRERLREVCRENERCEKEEEDREEEDVEDDSELELDDEEE